MRRSKPMIHRDGNPPEEQRHIEASEGHIDHLARLEEIDALEAGLAGDKQAPYPNDYSCLIRPSSEFQEGTFRSQDRVHEGKVYRALMAKPKGSNKMKDQSLRYKKKIWKAAEARRHCEDHDGKYEG